MPHDGGVVRQAPEFVRLDAVFLTPLVSVGRVVEMDRAQDVCQIALVERHRATGQVTSGFVSGFGYNTDCAVASTVAHDSHHMIVVGTSKDDMALAANTLGEVGGGIVVVSKGKVKALVELPIDNVTPPTV